MASKKKTKKKQTKTRKAGKKVTPPKRAVRKSVSEQKPNSRKKLARKKAATKTAWTASAVAKKKKTIAGKKTAAPRTRAGSVDESPDTAEFSFRGSGPRSGALSGDLQGLSNTEGADSESVDELLEEGNAFEADVVTGVEDAGDADEQEVHTHEVPEDDVPGEYLDEE